MGEKIVFARKRFSFLSQRCETLNGIHPQKGFFNATVGTFSRSDFLWFFDSVGGEPPRGVVAIVVVPLCFSYDLNLFFLCLCIVFHGFPLCLSMSTVANFSRISFLEMSPCLSSKEILEVASGLLFHCVFVCALSTGIALLLSMLVSTWLLQDVLHVSILRGG